MVTLKYRGNEFKAFITSIDKDNFKKADILMETGYTYRALSLATFNKPKWITVHNEFIDQSTKETWLAKSSTIPQIYFVDIEYGEELYAMGGIGFTKRTYGYSVGTTKEEAEKAMADAKNRYFESKNEKVRVESVRVSNTAISPFIESYSFPEQIPNRHLIPNANNM